MSGPALVTKPRLEFKDTIRFEPIKEDRGPYFVEYHVPNEGEPFAVVFLVFTQAAEAKTVAKAMEDELEHWSKRYPVPIMATAFNDTEDVIHLKPVRSESHLIGWIDSTGQPRLHWRLLKNEEIPSRPFTKAMLLDTYADIPYAVSTAEDKSKSFANSIRQNRIIRNIVILWFVAIPIAAALFTQFVDWAGKIATTLSVLTGLWKLAEIKGWLRKSKRQQEKEAEELRMKHHHYYCERDPEAFNRLKVGVLNREFRERILKEAEELKRKSL